MYLRKNNHDGVSPNCLPEELLLRQLQQESSRGLGRRSCVMLEGRDGRGRPPAPRCSESGVPLKAVKPSRLPLDARCPIVSIRLTAL